MYTSIPNNVWTQHVAFCIARRLTGQNYGISFIYTPLIYYSKFWESIVFLTTHPCETEIYHNVQSCKPYFLRKSDDKELSWFTCFWNSYSIYVSGFSVHSCQQRQLEYSTQNKRLGVLITSQTQKLQSFINANENTALWNKASIWNDSTKNSSTKIYQYISGLVPFLHCKFTTILDLCLFFFFKTINSIVLLRDLLIFIFLNVFAFIQMLDISVLLTHSVLRWFAPMVPVICETEIRDRKAHAKAIQK